MGHDPKQRDESERGWPLEGFYRSQLKAMQAHQKWIWKDSYFPEIGWLWDFTKFLLRIITYPVRAAYRLQRRQRRLKEFRAFIHGEEQR